MSLDISGHNPNQLSDDQRKSENRASSDKEISLNQNLTDVTSDWPGRVEIARSVDIDQVQPNCASFAFYLVGLIPVEDPEGDVVHRHDGFFGLRDQLMEVSEPLVGGLVGWELHEMVKGVYDQKDPREFMHWAVISAVDPVRVHQRPATFHDVQLDVSLEDALTFDIGPHTVRYFRLTMKA